MVSNSTACERFQTSVLLFVHFCVKNCKDPQSQLCQYIECQARTKRALPSCHISSGSSLLGLNQNKSCFQQGINLFLGCISILFTILLAEPLLVQVCVATSPSLVSAGKIQAKVEMVRVKEESPLCFYYNDLLHKHSRLG